MEVLPYILEHKIAAIVRNMQPTDFVRIANALYGGGYCKQSRHGATSAVVILFSFTL